MLAQRIAIGASTGAFLAAAWSFVAPSYYQSGATILPEARSRTPELGSAAELLGQFGGNLLQSSSGPQFYAELFRSRSVLTELVRTSFAPTAGAAPVPLESLLVPRRTTSAERTEAAIRRLRALSSVGFDTRTGLVSVDVYARSPHLAKQIADSLVSAVGRFDIERRQTRARAERRFVEHRVAELRNELREAEDSLRSFYSANRSFEQSPELRFVEARLQRDVSIRQEIYLAIARQLEDARINEVRDIPVFTVVDTATVPTRRSLPRRRMITLLGLVMGSVLGAAAGRLLPDRAPGAAA